MTCENPKCGKQFTTVQPSTKYCCGACRVADFRRHIEEEIKAEKVTAGANNTANVEETLSILKQRTRKEVAKDTTSIIGVLPSDSLKNQVITHGSGMLNGLILMGAIIQSGLFIGYFYAYAKQSVNRFPLTLMFFLLLWMRMIFIHQSCQLVTLIN